MRLLIVGDLEGQISSAILIAKKNGAKVHHCLNTGSALKYLREGRGVDLVMIDVKFNIENFINSILKEHICVPVVACGLENDSQSAVKAIKAGAKEYIPLPPDEELIAAIISAITEESGSFICISSAMKKAMHLADQIAASEASVLITGESGTGKEVFAKYIHSKSKHSEKDMVCVNCAAIPENLLESELFGHEKGAFTGAVERRIGKFEEANGSTLLLDEISEMDLKLQAKLLRVIQEKKVDRVGGSKPIDVDIRILATSNRNLAEEVQEGNFREDLFYRLNVINIKLPGLRLRKEEIKHFVASFVDKFTKVNNLPHKNLSAAALSKLEGYSWPGNVRELENVIHRAVLVSSGKQITEGDLVFSNANVDTESHEEWVGRTVGSVEKELILNTVDHCLGNRTHAANILGISIRTLRNKLNEYKEKPETKILDEVCQ